MTYRPLTEADIEPYLALERYAFQANPDRSGLDAAKMARFRGLFDGPDLAAQLELIPLRLQTGLGELAAAGIGSVATPPERRRRGAVAALLGHTAAELRASGVALTLLYPFKASFYGRYGWATCMERRVYSGRPALFAGFRPGPGGFAPAGPAEVAELDQIYRGALRGRFGPARRDPAWWEEQLLLTWERRRRHAYIWRDEQGRGRSYLIYEIGPEKDGAPLTCREIVALDPPARAQLFAFLAGHEDQVGRVEFRAPADAPVNLLFPDPLDCRVEPYFMLRLLDVPAALAGYGFPRELTGRLTIRVADDWIAENNAVFAVEFARGAAEVTRLPDDAPAEISCDVRALAQIYSRYLRPRTAAAFGALAAAARPALDLAEQAFAGLAPFSSDFF